MRSDIMAMIEDLLAWDGKSAGEISAVYQHYRDDPGFLDELITLSEQPATQMGATWLLKHHFDNGGILNTGQIKQIYQLLPGLQDWGSKLHILQCIPQMPITEASRKAVEGFVRQCLNEKNKFVRAWAYNGFNELARQYPQYQETVKLLIEKALETEAASVKARIRNILKKKS